MISMSRNQHSDITKGKKKIARQLIFYIVIFSSLITLFITVLQLYRDYSREVGQIENQIEQIKKSSLQSLTRSLWDIYDSQLRLQLEGILQLPDIQYLEVSTDGKVYVSVGKLQSENTISATFPMVHIFDNKEKIIGELQIVATVDKVYQRLYNKVLFILFFNGIKTFIVSAFMFFIFHFFVIRHLEKISSHTKSTTYDSNSVLTMDRKDKNDELQEVVGAINNMRRNLLESFTKLKISERRFRAMFEQAAIGVAQVETKTGRFVKINQKYCDIVGYSPKEMETMKFQDITHPDDLQTDLNNMNKLTKGMISGFSVEKRYVGKDGSIVWGNLTVSHLLGNGEKQEYNLAIVEDITGRKQAEAEKENLEKRLQQAHKMEAIGTLAGGIAHDFNNILSAIIGFSELAKESIPTENPAQKDIDLVLKSSLRAADLVQQILTFSRKSDQHIEPLSPHLIVKEALKMLRPSLPTTIKIVENIDNDCGKITANPTNIHQIIVNLCANSLHAMAEEKGTISVSLERKEMSFQEIPQGSTASPGPFIVLKVTDTGCGMNENIKKQIFEPYFTTKEVGKGTGLGLAVIHGIIEDCQGFIVVESKLGEGTTFNVHIPALKQEKETSNKVTTTETVPTGTEQILVVDDDDAIANLNKTQLERLGYKVTSITNSPDALEKILNDPSQFDLIITDQTMPDMTGAELAKKVLRIEPEMLFVLCTGYSSIITEKDTLAIGIKKYVRKPVDKRTLANVVRQVLDQE